MLFFRSYFFKGSETDLNKLVQKQLALNSTITILEKLQPTYFLKINMGPMVLDVDLAPMKI